MRGEWMGWQGWGALEQCSKGQQTDLMISANVDSRHMSQQWLR